VDRLNAYAAQKTLRQHYGHSLAGSQSRSEDERLRALHKAACRYASVLAAEPVKPNETVVAGI